MSQVPISFGSDNPLVVAQWQVMLRGLPGVVTPELQELAEAAGVSAEAAAISAGQAASAVAVGVAGLKSEFASATGAGGVGAADGVTVATALAEAPDRTVGEPFFVETAIGTLGLPAVPNNANTYNTNGANIGEGGLTVSLTSGAVGANIVTAAETSIVAGFGNIAWPCAIEYADQTHEFNIVMGDNGVDTITLQNPLSKSAVGAKLSCKYAATADQHLTKRATRAWVECVYAQREIDCVGTHYIDGAWYDQPPKYQSVVARNAALISYGSINVAGVVTTLINEVTGQTMYDSDGYLIRPLNQNAGAQVGLHLVGHGAEAIVNVAGQTGMLEAFVGEQKAASGGNGLDVIVYGRVNGVESVIYRRSMTRGCTRVVAPYSGFDSLRLSVVATVDGARYIRVTEMRAWVTAAKARRLIDKNGRLLAMGDSWLAYYDGEFARWLQVCMRRDGGIGTVTNAARSGTTSKYGLDWFDTRFALGKFTQVYCHFYTNDANSAQVPSLVYTFPNPAGVPTDYRMASMDEWRSCMMAMAAKSIAGGAQFVMPRPGGTASAAQTSYQQLWGRKCTPGLCVNDTRQALADELSDPLSAINVTGKKRGSKVLVGNSTFSATGGGAADPWIDPLGSRVAVLEAQIFDFFPYSRGTFVIGTDSNADGVSDGVAVTSYSTTTNITATNSIVSGKQKTSINYASGFGPGGFRQRYQYPAIAGHKYLLVCKLTGCTASRSVDRILSNADGTNGNVITPAASTDASGNSLSFFTSTEVATLTRSFFVNLSSPASPMTLDTVAEAVYMLDLTAADAALGTSLASMTAAEAFAIVYPALTKVPPTALRLTDTVTAAARLLSIANGVVTVT